MVAVNEYDLNLNFNTGPLSVGEVMKRARIKYKSRDEEAIYVIVQNLGYTVFYSKSTWQWSPGESWASWVHVYEVMKLSFELDCVSEVVYSVVELSILIDQND